MLYETPFSAVTCRRSTGDKVRVGLGGDFCCGAGLSVLSLLFTGKLEARPSRV